MDDFLKYTLEGAAALYALRLAIEQGEFVTGWVFEQVWRGLEIGTGGRVRREGGGWLGRKIKGWLSFAFWTIADPFLVILRSLMPDNEPEPAEEPPKPEPDPKPPPEAEGREEPEPQPSPRAKHQEEAEPKPSPGPTEKTRPTEAQYQAAIERLGLYANCQRTTAAKKWAAMQAAADPSEIPEINAAWLTICEYRGFRPD